MQTFLPCPSFIASANMLDNKRLGKQRVEAKQIYLSLTDPDYGWKNHPAVKMWKGYEGAIAVYGAVICREWRRRGFTDSLFPWFEERCPETFKYPWWMWNARFHISHQSNLLRKDPEYYGPKFPEVPYDLDYIWPTKDLEKPYLLPSHIGHSSGMVHGIFDSSTDNE